MTKEYDFSRGRRGPVIKPSPGKTRITIRLDEDIIQWFRDQVHAAGGGSYQTLINDALRRFIEADYDTLEDTMRRVVREELAEYGAGGGRAENPADRQLVDLERLYAELQALLRAIVAGLPGTFGSIEIVRVYFGAKAYRLGCAIETLCASGFTRESRTLLRILTEHYITYRYIEQEPSRAEDFIRFGPIDAWRWLDAIRSFNIWGFTEAQLDDWESRYKLDFDAVRSDFENKRGRLYQHWHGRTIRQLASEVGDGLPELYEFAYRDTSQAVHPSDKDAVDYVHQEGNRIAPVLEGNSEVEDRGFVLSLAAKLNIEMAATLNNACLIGRDAPVEALDKELMQLLKRGVAMPQPGPAGAT